MGLEDSIVLAALDLHPRSARARDGAVTGASDSFACLVTGRRPGVDLILRGQSTHRCSRDSAGRGAQQRISTDCA
jgi:hypothetical protein